MTNYKQNMTGLSSVEVKKLQDKYGKNELTPQKKESFLKKVFHIICEPMFLLLIVAAVIYFILGEPRDGAIMLIFVIGIISIEIRYSITKTCFLKQMQKFYQIWRRKLSLVG